MRSFKAIASLVLFVSASAFADGQQSFATLYLDFSEQIITDAVTGETRPDTDLPDLTVEIFGGYEGPGIVVFEGEIAGLGLSKVALSHRFKEPDSLFYVTVEKPEYYSENSPRPWGVDLITAFISVVGDDSPDQLMISGHYSGFIDRLGGLEDTRGGKVTITIVFH